MKIQAKQTENTKYMLTMDGQALLDKPMTLKDIVTSFGSIPLLEKQGYRIVQWQQ